MLKDVQMSIKMEADLHQQLMAIAAAIHTPAAQLVRQLIRKFIAFQQTPNKTTIAAMEAADRGEGIRFKSIEALFKDLDI